MRAVCWLRVVCWLLFGVCCLMCMGLLLDVWCVCVVCCVLFAFRWSFFCLCLCVVCCVLFVVRCCSLVVVVCGLAFVVS